MLAWPPDVGKLRGPYGHAVLISPTGRVPVRRTIWTTWSSRSIAGAVSRMVTVRSRAYERAPQYGQAYSPGNLSFGKDSRQGHACGAWLTRWGKRRSSRWSSADKIRHLLRGRGRTRRAAIQSSYVRRNLAATARAAERW